VTSDGRPKIIDVMDCSGSGDVDMRTKVKADEDLIISSVSGRKLKVNASWTNPSGEWRVGSKHLYSLIPSMLVSRLKEEKKRRWEEKHRQAMVIASQPEGSSPSSLPSPSGSAKQKSAELDARVTFLKEAEKAREDLGPLIEVVTWHDGSNWRVALDTSELAQIVKESKLQAASEGLGVNDGALANFAEPLTDYKTERKFGTFSALDSCHYAINILSNGDVVSIVVDAGAHGTHVAGIVGAYFPDDPSLNGIAPGCQIISLKIGDTRLGSMETGTALTRAFIAAKEAGVDLINMSYGEPTSTPNAGRLVELANELVEEHGIIFVASAGNSGPALSTVGAPGGTSSSILGIGAYVSPSLAEAGHSVRSLPPSDEAGSGGVAGQQYTWSSRGPTMDGDLGVNFSAPGGAIAPVPSWCLAKRQLMWVASSDEPNMMAMPHFCSSLDQEWYLHGLA
jgi:tripeptidyl-peptidase-2